MSKLIGRTFIEELTGNKLGNQVTVRDLMKASGRSNGYVYNWIATNKPDRMLYGTVQGSRHRVLTIPRDVGQLFVDESNKLPRHSKKRKPRSDIGKKRKPQTSTDKTVTVCIEVPSSLAGAIKKLDGDIQAALQRETDCWCEIMKAELREFVKG